MYMSKPTELLRRITSALCTLLVGCAVGPNFLRPEAPSVTQYTPSRDPTATRTAQGIAQRFIPGTSLVPDWWLLFGSPTLQAIVTEALARNPGLEAARASLAASKDDLRSGYGVFYPELDADARGTRQRYSAVELGENAPGTVFNLFTLSASVNYALDLFGGERRMLEGMAAQVDVQRATEQATYLTLIANIVNTVIAKAAYRAEIDATHELIDLEHQQVNLAQIQFQAGTQPYASVLSLQSQLASNEATVPQLEQKLAESDDLLATLAGEVPSNWRAPTVSLKDLTLPRVLPVSLPSDLVRQRPDILLAEATAHAASANVGVATAALLPSVTLSGSYSASGTATQQLFGSNGRAWSLGVDAATPLFEGGTLWYRRRAALDAYRQSLALYRQTVLSAFAQVADTLRALDHDASALNAEDEALATAQQALHLIEINYEAGLNTYLDVLNADAQYHQAMINDFQAVAVRYQDTVALYVALGGGWWNGEPDAPSTPGGAPH